MKARRITLSQEESQNLSAIINSPKSEQRMAQRASIIVALSEGLSEPRCAAMHRVCRQTVAKWRARFERLRLDGLLDAPRPGQPVRYGKDVERAVLGLLETRPGDGHARWNASLVGRRLSLPVKAVCRILRRNHIDLGHRRSWCVGTDPEFEAKAADIVGLYLNPPENALVVCVDEKPCIQAIERAQGWLTFADGETMEGFSDRYRRHGCTTLFAALEVATGQVFGKTRKRKRRREFLDFMNELVARHPGQELHVVLDNLSTHSKKDGRWLSRHPSVHFHFTPTNASWLNQVEIFFSILARGALDGASFSSVRQLTAAIRRFIENRNSDAVPFEWKKAKVMPKGFKKTLAD